MDKWYSADGSDNLETLPEEQIEKIEQEFVKRMTERRDSSGSRARSLLEYSDEPIIGSSSSIDLSASAIKSISADIDSSSMNQNETDLQPETILVPQDIEYVSEACLSSPISEAFRLAPNSIAALESLGCKTVRDLVGVKVSDFVAIRGMTIGKVGSIRAAFRKWSNLASGHSDNSFGKSDAGTLFESIIPESLYEQIDDVKRRTPIRAALNLTSGVYRALESINCKTIGDLLSTKAGDFVSIKGISLGKLNSLRKEFTRWLNNPSGNEGVINEAVLGSGSTLITLPPEPEIPAWLLKSKISETMQLTPGVYRTFESLGCETIEDLLRVETVDFLKADGIGKGAVSRVRKEFMRVLPASFTGKTTYTVRIAKDVQLLAGERYIFDAQLSRPIELIDLKYPDFLPSTERENNAQSEERAEYDAIESVETFGVPTWMRRIRISWLTLKRGSEEFDNSTIEDVLTGEKESESYEKAEDAVAFLYSLWSLTSQAESSTELIAQCLIDSNNKLNTRSIDIFLQREATIPKKTLQDIAEEEGITRERVRQLDSKANKSLDLKASRRFLPVRLVVLAAALDLGGAGTTSDLSSVLRAAKLPFEGDLLAFAAVSPDIEIDKSDKTFSLADSPCKDCSSLKARVRQLSDSAELIGIEKFYSEVGCVKCILRPSAVWLESRFADIGTDGQYVGSKKNPSTPSVKHPKKSERAIVRSIMFDATGALTYDEIIQAFQSRTGKPMSRARASSHVGGLGDCLLWGRGTYIHESKISFPVELLHRISDWICSQFENRHIPILGIGGIFDFFEKDLIAANVPTQHALYSLLRRIQDSRLELREYPWVCDSRNIGEKTSFAKYFYWVLEQNNGFITDAHAEGIAERAMAQSFALGGLAEYSPFLINANGGWYDIEAADFDMEGVASLARDVAARMRENDIVSTVKVFEDNKERCVRYGVKSHDILYYLIDMMEDDLPIEATRRPHLVKSSHKGLSALTVMRMYIKDSSHPVPIEELYEEFITKRRLNFRNICTSLIVNDDIIEIGKGVFWSRSKMNIDNDFINEFDKVVANATKHSRKTADLYYSRDELFSTYAGLPSIPDMRWSEELLVAVFSRSSRFKLLGEDAKCLVDMQENPDVFNVETFYHALLKNEFYGWSTFGSFVDYCNSRSIRKNLEPEFFDAFDTIQADEYSIEAL